MTLIELYQSNEAMRGVLTEIMTKRNRMNYKRWAIENELRKHGIDIGYVSTGQAYELHYLVNPDDPPRVLKPNLTARRKQRPVR